jgi:hypothetical protein
MLSEHDFKGLKLTHVSGDFYFWEHESVALNNRAILVDTLTLVFIHVFAKNLFTENRKLIVDQIKDDEMDGTYSACGDVRNTYSILEGKSEWKEHVGDLCVDG